MTDLAASKYGWNNPAPGTRLWRLHNHPETLSREDAAKVALDLLAHIDAITADLAAARQGFAILLTERDAITAALRKTVDLAQVANEGDPWFATDAGIDADAVLNEALAILRGGE